jgi:hypothetical protein
LHFAESTTESWNGIIVSIFKAAIQTLKILNSISSKNHMFVPSMFLLLLFIPLLTCSLRYRTADCFFKKKAPIHSLNDVKGAGGLQSNDQEKLKRWIEENDAQEPQSKEQEQKQEQEEEHKAGDEEGDDEKASKEPKKQGSQADGDKKPKASAEKPNKASRASTDAQVSKTNKGTKGPPQQAATKQQIKELKGEEPKKTTKLQKRRPTARRSAGRKVGTSLSQRLKRKPAAKQEGAAKVMQKKTKVSQKSKEKEGQARAHEAKSEKTLAAGHKRKREDVHEKEKHGQQQHQTPSPAKHVHKGGKAQDIKKPKQDDSEAKIKRHKAGEMKPRRLTEDRKQQQASTKSTPEKGGRQTEAKYAKGVQHVRGKRGVAGQEHKTHRKDREEHEKLKDQSDDEEYSDEYYNLGRMRQAQKQRQQDMPRSQKKPMRSVEKGRHEAGRGQRYRDYQQAEEGYDESDQDHDRRRTLSAAEHDRRVGRMHSKGARESVPSSRGWQRGRPREVSEAEQDFGDYDDDDQSDLSESQDDYDDDDYLPGGRYYERDWSDFGHDYAWHSPWDRLEAEDWDDEDSSGWESDASEGQEAAYDALARRDTQGRTQMRRQEEAKPRMNKKSPLPARRGFFERARLAEKDGGYDENSDEASFDHGDESGGRRGHGYEGGKWKDTPTSVARSARGEGRAGPQNLAGSGRGMF